MDEIVKVKAQFIFPFVSEIIEQGQSIRITVTGNSMFPFLRDGLDSVEFSQATYTSLSKGDIVLIRREDGTYVMHRILQRDKERFFMIGDAQERIEGPLYPDQLVAVVSSVWRKNKQIYCSSFIWRFLSQIWLFIIPYRKLIFKVSHYVPRFIKKQFQ